MPFVITVGVWAAPAASDLNLPEKIFPQLDGILKSAVQQSPRMLNRALDLEVAENSRIQARAGLLPTVNGNTSYFKTSDDRADLAGRQKLTKTYYYFSANQPVYYWGERSNNAKIGEIQAAVAQGSYKEAYRLLAQELRTSYLGLIAQKIVVKRAHFNLEFSNNQLAQAEARLQTKVISDAEIFPIRIAAEQAQIWVERSEFDLATAKASFARLAGIGLLADDAIPDQVPATSYTPATFDSLLTGYLAQKDLPTTEAVNARRQLEIQNLNYKTQKVALRPKINFIVGTSQDEQSFTLNVAQKYKVNSIFAGFGLNWAIFDGFSSQAGTRSALARRRQMENDYRELTERLTQQAQSQVKLLNFAARNMSIYDRLLESGEGNLKTKRDEFKQGIRSEADLSLAQISLYDAQVNAVVSRNDFLLKTSEFLGTIMEDPVLANVAGK